MPGKLFKKIGLTALFVGLSTAFATANAAPDPVFDSVIDDIRSELPEGWQFRLPSEMPLDSEIYPFVSEASDTKLVVSLGITPDCTSADCTIGVIGAVDAGASSWPPEGESVTPVDLGQDELGQDLEGYYLLQGEGTATNQLVMWQQDGLLYGIVTVADALPQEQLVAVASSMASEPPIDGDASMTEPPIDGEPPVTEPPIDGEPPVTEPPMTEPPVDSVPPVTEPPITEPPVDGVPPVTEPPIDGEPPVTEPPIDGEPPVTEPPIDGEPPVTEPPITEPPIDSGVPPVTEPPIDGEPPVTEPPIDSEPPVTEPPIDSEPPVTEPPIEDEAP
ncbi:MAG: hypothetical protein AAFX95_10050 [Cyanobacteria bacterium J06639_16]